jgi:hypothetical protein
MFMSVVGQTSLAEVKYALPHVQYLTKIMYRETGYAFLWVKVVPTQQQGQTGSSVVVEFDER